MIDISDHPAGCVLLVKAQPGARRAAIVGEHGGALKVAVTAPPEDGRANKALIDLLSDQLGVKRAHIELLGGAASREKKFLLHGLAASTLAARLEELLGP
ncbi:MAG: DUF167 domain-containing protein [Gemmataceae bacterium]